MSVKFLKRMYRRLRLRGLGVHEQVAIDSLPLAYNEGAWVVHPDVINASSVVYSFGVGRNISWDLAMIKRFGLTVHAFDPTPRSIEWVQAQNLPVEFVFHDYGVADVDGTMKLFPPRRESSFHYSSIKRSNKQDSGQAIEAAVYRLSSIMNKLGHDRIDVLKMDIEGAEYGVIEDIVNSGVKVGQLLVEFHHNFRGVRVQRTADAVQSLHDLGYRIFHVSDRSYELALIHIDALEAVPTEAVMA